MRSGTGFASGLDYSGLLWLTVASREQAPGLQSYSDLNHSVIFSTPSSIISIETAYTSRI